MCLRPWAEVQDRQQREPTQCPTLIKTAAVAVAAALACAVAGAADFSAQTIRLAHTAAVSHAHHEAALQFAKNVSERTGGKVKVEVYPAGELGDQPALAEQVTLGALDSAVVSLGNLAMYSKKLNAMIGLRSSSRTMITPTARSTPSSCPG